MTTLYAVTSSCLDEDCTGSHVERIFSTRDGAKDWIGPATGEYSIKEMTLDDVGATRPTTCHTVRIYADSGMATDENRPGQTRVELRPSDFREESRLIGYHPPSATIVACSTISAEHAAELAAQERARWIASFKTPYLFVSSNGQVMTIGPEGGATAEYEGSQKSMATHQAECLREIGRMFRE